MHDDDKVFSFTDWCHKNGFSLATGRRILAGGDGPAVIQLSARRIGIRQSDDRAWLDRRTRHRAAAAPAPTPPVAQQAAPGAESADKNNRIGATGSGAPSNTGAPS